MLLPSSFHLCGERQDGFQGLDFVVYKAGEKGLHSIIVFADFWSVPCLLLVK